MLQMRFYTSSKMMSISTPPTSVQFLAGDLRQKFANQIVVAAADGCIAALGAARYVEAQRTVARTL